MFSNTNWSLIKVRFKVSDLRTHRVTISMAETDALMGIVPLLTTSDNPYNHKNTNLKQTENEKMLLLKAEEPLW